MNRTKLFPLSCAATLFLTGLARADNASGAPSAPGAEIVGPALAPPQHRDRPLTAQEQALLTQYDKNGDGRLDQAELAAAHGATQQQKTGREARARRIYDRLLEKFDTAKEGKLNPEEQRQAVEFLKTRPRIYAMLVKQFDRNGDGQLSGGEIDAVFQYLGNLPSGLSKMVPKEEAAAEDAMDGSMTGMAPSAAATPPPPPMPAVPASPPAPAPEKKADPDRM